jgi:hypothetical protein
LALVLVLALATPTPGPASVQSQALTAPLREVMYNVSTSLRIDDITDSFGGGEGAVPPASGDSSGDRETVTVDVMAKLDDGTLAIKVTELWRRGGARPSVLTGAVAPNGTVRFGASTINDVTRELLPYFGTGFTPDGTLALSKHWSLDQTFTNASVSTQYTVVAVNATTATIHKVQSIKSQANASVDGTIQYDLASLEPISGRVVKRMTVMFVDGQTAATLDLRFDRVSDTLSHSL